MDQPAAPSLLIRFGIDVPGLRNAPHPLRWVLATFASVLGSLVACWIVVRIAVAIVPSSASYEHFATADWAKLTVVGVLLAAVGWPVVAVLSSRARLVYLVLAVVVTIASFLPDVWILMHGQSAYGVGALAVMHLGLAVVTYPAMVLIAPPRGGLSTAA